jgi:hypothetical protein
MEILKMSKINTHAGRVGTFGFLNFDLVSDFEFSPRCRAVAAGRISDFHLRAANEKPDG